MASLIAQDHLAKKWLARVSAGFGQHERSPGFWVALRLFPTKQGPLTLAPANTIRWYSDNAFGKYRRAILQYQQSPGRNEADCHHASSWSSALASCRTGVSKPSVNQP
jgi:hypothetical protein